MHKFELFCMLALIGLDKSSLASEVHKSLNECVDKDYAFSGLYTTLNRMVGKKWVSRKMHFYSTGTRRSRYKYTTLKLGRDTVTQTLNDIDQVTKLTRKN